MRDDDIIYGSARAVRLAARHAWRRLGHTLPFLREHPDVAEAVAEQLVASAGCSKEEHDRLSEHLLHILPADRARHWKRVYTERCVGAARNRHGDSLDTYNPLQLGNQSSGRWWMYDRGLLPNPALDRVGLLYIRLPPWGLPSILSVLWGLSGDELVVSATLVHYSPLWGGRALPRSHMILAETRRFTGLDFPEAPVRMSEMVERVGRATDRPDWHRDTRQLAGPFDGFSATRSQLLTILSLTRGEVGDDGVVAVRGVTSDRAAEVGLEVRQLAPDEYLVGANRRADWLALRDRAQGGGT